MLGYFFFDPASVTLVPVAGVCSFLSRNLRFLSFLSLLPSSEDSAALVRGGAGVFFSAGFASLGLDSSGRGSFADVPLVCTFEAVLLEGRWPQEQRIFESRTMVLDLRPTFASALTVFYTISSKSMASQSCYSISILIESLRLFRK